MHPCRTAVVGTPLSAKTDFKLLAAASKRAGDAGRTAVQDFNLGVTHDNSDAFAQAIVAYKAFLKMMTEPLYVCLGLNAIAISAHCQGDLATALAYHAEHARAAPDVRNRALALCNAGLVHRILGNLRDAESCFMQALTMARDSGDSGIATLAAGHIGISATLAPASPVEPLVKPQARVLLALPPLGLRPSVGSAPAPALAAAHAPPPASPAAGRSTSPTTGGITAAALRARSSSSSPTPASASSSSSSSAASSASSASATTSMRRHRPPDVTSRAELAGANVTELTGVAASQRPPRALAESAEGASSGLPADRTPRSEALPLHLVSVTAKSLGHGASRLVEAIAASPSPPPARLETAREALEQTVDLLTDSDDPRNRAELIARLGIVAAAKGDFAGAAERFAEARARATAASDPRAAALHKCNQAVASARQFLHDYVQERLASDGSGMPRAP